MGRWERPSHGSGILVNCPRCQGLIIAAWEDVRCVNCGWRQTEQEVVSTMSDVTTCKRCDLPPLPGRKLCQTHRDMQMVYQSNYQAKNAARNRETADRPAPSRTTVVRKAAKPSTELVQRTPRPTHIVDSVVLSPSPLDEVIVKLREDLQALERAKTILERESA